MSLTVYLSGEIHTDWRDQITEGARGLDAVFTGPVTDHAASDDCGVRILGDEPDKFWHDNKGANVNAIRTRNAIAAADIVVVRFGEKYKQWNAAFDAGYAAALGKSLIIMHGPDHQHALKEVDAAALAVTETPEQASVSCAKRKGRCPDCTHQASCTCVRQRHIGGGDDPTTGRQTYE